MPDHCYPRYLNCLPSVPMYQEPHYLYMYSQIPCCLLLFLVRVHSDLRFQSFASPEIDLLSSGTQYFNLYKNVHFVTQEAVTTIEMPFVKTVKQGGSVAPGKQTFEFILLRPLWRQLLPRRHRSSYGLWRRDLGTSFRLQALSRLL